MTVSRCTLSRTRSSIAAKSIVRAGKRIKVSGWIGPGLGDCGFLLVPAAPPQQTVDARQENGQVERLGKIVVGPCFESTQNVSRAPARGQHQNRNELADGSKLRGDRKSVLAGQHDVEDDGVERLPVDQQHAERAFAVGHNRRLVSLRFEVEPQAVGNVLLVFDDQDPAHDTTRLERKRYGGFAASAADASRGSSTVNVEPRPSPSLCTKTRPPCARAIDLTM